MASSTRRSVLATGAAALATPMLIGRARAATELVVTVNGGTFEEGWRKAIIEPFEKANPGVTVKVSQGLTFQALALMRAQKDNPAVDVLMMDEVAASQAAGEGLAHPLSVQTVPNLEGLYPEMRVAGTPYTKIYFVPEVLAYATGTFKTPPASYAELWDPKYKGRVALGNLDTAIGLMAFLIINEMKGGTIENVEPGFAAIKELKDKVLTFPTSHAQVSQLFTQGDIVLIPWVSDRATTLARSGAPVAWTIPKEGAIVAEGTLSIAKGTKNLEAALRYVDFAISPEGQAAMTKYNLVSPVSAKAVLDPETAKAIPNGADAVKRARRPDWAKVNEHRGRWLERWNREILS